jgi:uncharacterized membrane protein
MHLLLLALLVLTSAPLAHAESLGEESSTTSSVVTEKAKVLSVTSTEVKDIVGTDMKATYQTLRAEVLSGPDKGRIVSVENDYLVMSPGDVFFLTHTINEAGGIDAYSVLEPYRLPALGWLLAAFVVIVIAVGGWTGLRGLLALAGSILAVFYILLPGLAAGYDPFLISLGVAALIVLVSAYLTHRVSRTTHAAVLGMLATIALTAAIAHFAIGATQLSGFSDESTVWLNFASDGSIDFVGLLLGAMLIGTLGILYDAAIGQAVAVDELLRAMPQMPVRRLFARAMRIGREHIGALVNTLAIAYVGVALPLLILFQSYGDEAFLQVVNREMFATEVVRALVGSMGIVLAVPITTLAAIFLLAPRSLGGAGLTHRSRTDATMEPHERPHSHG